MAGLRGCKVTLFAFVWLFSSMCLLTSPQTAFSLFYLIEQFSAFVLRLPLCSHWFCQTFSQAPGFVLPFLSSHPGCIFLFWWRREFEDRASGVKAVAVNPGTLGSSGIVIKYLSSSSLRVSTEHFVIFLKNGGRLLKSCGPCTWNVCSLSAFDDALAPV